MGGGDGGGGGGVVRVVRARRGVGTHWEPLNVSILSKHLRNASQVWVVARQSGPGVGSGEGGDRGAVEVVG